MNLVPGNLFVVREDLTRVSLNQLEQGMKIMTGCGRFAEVTHIAKSDKLLEIIRLGTEVFSPITVSPHTPVKAFDEEFDIRNLDMDGGQLLRITRGDWWAVMNDHSWWREAQDIKLKSSVLAVSDDGQLTVERIVDFGRSSTDVDEGYEIRTEDASLVGSGLVIGDSSVEGPFTKDEKKPYPYQMWQD